MKTRSQCLFILMTACLLGMSLAGCQTSILALPLSQAPKAQILTPQGDYILGPLDEVKIATVGGSTLDGVYTISEDGNIPLPLAGNVQIAKKTLSSALETITNAAAPFLKKPSLSLTLASKKSYRTFYGGELTRVGMIVLDSPTNLLSAISLAGGLTPYATGRIVVIRKASDGKTRRFAVLYKELQNGLKDYDSFIVDRGDFIIAE
ncbi:MAG: polysaccharide biosynthesis/export family protein [Pseudomonadota bacterium]